MRPNCRTVLVVVALSVLVQAAPATSSAATPADATAAPAVSTTPEPASTDPVPTDPVPPDPVPTDPVPPDPVSSDAAPTEPAPTEPAPTEPAPTEPAPTTPSDTREGTSATGAAALPSPVRKVFMRRDVVVYGGTPAGVATAIAAADRGVRVVLVTEGATVGGMMSNGISAADIGSAGAVQGLAREFFDRIRTHYRDPATWRFEPRVAERVLVRMLDEAGVDVRRSAPLRSVTVVGTKITCGLFGTSISACGTTFVDASYTGDLIARAGVPNRLGMGDFFAYEGEALPDLRTWTSILRVPADSAAAARQAFEANPFVTVQDTLEPYSTAHKNGTPSLTYRPCVTKEPGNETAFRPGPDYAALVPSFQLLAGRMRNEVVTKSNGTLLSDAFHLAVLPHGKYDLNAGRYSYTNLPSPRGYFDPQADRRAHNGLLRQYVESFFYFVQRDGTVPTSIRKAFAPFGLCADEFVGNGNWPREPYVREGRRIAGAYTMTEADIYRKREKGSAVALASYNLDSKLSQFVFADGTLYRDRGVHATAPVYEIPYSAMLPRAGSVVNLLAPVGVSASPTAYGSIRMEPQYMALGEAAGLAAALATSRKLTVSSVPASSVQAALRSRGTLHKAEDICRRTPQIFRPAGGYTFYCDVLPVTPRILE